MQPVQKRILTIIIWRTLFNGDIWIVKGILPKPILFRLSFCFIINSLFIQLLKSLYNSIHKLIQGDLS